MPTGENSQSKGTVNKELTPQEIEELKDRVREMTIGDDPEFTVVHGMFNREGYNRLKVAVQPLLEAIPDEKFVAAVNRQMDQIDMTTSHELSEVSRFSVSSLQKGVQDALKAIQERVTEIGKSFGRGA